MKKSSTLPFFIASACLLLVGIPAVLAQEADHDEFDEARFEWSDSPGDVEDALDDRVDSEHFGDYRRLTRHLTLDEERWQEFFVFYQDKLIAQGYQREERAKGPRVGTISDIVSYDNDYALARNLESKLGEPDFVDRRTKKEFSQELGDDGLRTERTLQWDMLGERYRWETDDGTIRYTIQYSMDGLKAHRMVNVNPAHWSHYFEFQTIQAFRDAGIELVRRFRKRSKKWVVTFSPSDTVKIDHYDAPEEAEPREPEREEYTYSDCRINGEDCRATFKYFGGHLYQVDIDFSKSGEFPRRGHHEEIGKSVYKHFDAVDSRLRRHFGKPSDSKKVDDFDNRREVMKAERLVQGQEGFWSMWYDVGNDVLVRHTITGESTGTGYETDHKVSFRFHSVARSLAERDAWERETAKAKKAASRE